MFSNLCLNLQHKVFHFIFDMGKNDKMTTRPKIFILYTGGTIGMVKDYKSNVLIPFDFNQIQERIPELQQLNCDIKSVSFESPIDSSNMNTDYYRQIVETIENHYDVFDGFVVLTGSDTMSYVSSAVSFMIENLQKPIIFTGSQLPIGDLRTDAKENLITAIQIASSMRNGIPMIREVGLYFEYKLYRANRTTKINANNFEAFDSMNYPILVESGVQLEFNSKFINVHPYNAHPPIFRKELNPNVAILKLFPGITEHIMRSVLMNSKVEAVVIETYGSGNAPTSQWFIKVLKDALEKGVILVNVTQCKGGGVVQGKYDTSLRLKKIGVLSAGDMTTEAAVSKLMYLLTKNLTKKDFKKYFKKSLRGEIS